MQVVGKVRVRFGVVGGCGGRVRFVETFGERGRVRGEGDVEGRRVRRARKRRRGEGMVGQVLL